MDTNELHGHAVARAVLEVLRQACAQGVEPDPAASAALAAAGKTLRLALGPKVAAGILRAVADETEADRDPLRAN